MNDSRTTDSSGNRQASRQPAAIAPRCDERIDGGGTPRPAGRAFQPGAITGALIRLLSLSSWAGRIARPAVLSMCCLGFIVSGISVTPVGVWYGNLLSGPREKPAGEVLIVLGAEFKNANTIGLESYWRSYYAAQAWREGTLREIVVSGNTIAPLMRDAMIVLGVPRGSIRLEETSLSTRENALLVKKLLEATPGRKVLMTSNQHMFRSRRAFQKAGLDVLPRPVDVTGTRWRERYWTFINLTEETAKIGYYFLRGWI